MSKKKRIKEENSNLDNQQVDKKKFKFVQKDEKIFDTKFETKPVGYFKDAMTRFAKNKTNVIATVIMFTLIFMSIIVPLTTNKRYEGEEHQLRFLPPRAPVLENYGIMDGMVDVTSIRVDRDTIDDETGLGIPSSEQYDPEFIDMDSLENYTVGCTDRQDYCTGGSNILEIESGGAIATLTSGSSFPVNLNEDSKLTVDISDMENTDQFDLRFYLEVPGSDNEYDEIAVIDEPGEHEIDLNDVLDTSNNIFSSPLRIEMTANGGTDGSVAFESIALNDDTQEDPLVEDSGYDLSMYSTGSSDASYNRNDGEILMASFKYDKYEEALGEREVPAMGSEEYNEIIEANPETCERQPHPDDPDNDEMAVFEEGCPIVEVLSQSEPIEYGDEEFFSYRVIVDYAQMAGYDETPYFLFGTDSSGRDLFALSWVALRTSLFIAVAVNIINISFGILYGAIEGYYGGKTDLLMERFAEVIGRIPWLVTLSIFVALLGSSITTLMFILIFSGWIGISSITRTQFYRYKRREYVLASRTLGAKDSRLIFRHILPNGIGTIITTSILSIPLVIFAESTISYLGFGIGHGTSFNVLGVEFSGVSIGVLLADARTHMYARPYLTVFPAIIISLLMITFNMFGNALRDAFNPALRGVDE